MLNSICGIYPLDTHSPFPIISFHHHKYLQLPPYVLQKAKLSRWEALICYQNSLYKIWRWSCYSHSWNISRTLSRLYCKIKHFLMIFNDCHNVACISLQLQLQLKCHHFSLELYTSSLLNGLILFAWFLLSL